MPKWVPGYKCPDCGGPVFVRKDRNTDLPILKCALCVWGQYADDLLLEDEDEDEDENDD